MSVEFRVLGSLQVSRDGIPIMLGATMLRRLLAALLCEAGKPVAAITLIDALWGGTPPPSARKTLQVYVHRLRKAIGGEPIEHDAGRYTMRVGPGELDVLHFHQLSADGRSAWRRGELRLAGSLYGQALRLWRGAAYADFDDFEFVMDEARRLEERRLLAYEDLVAVNFTLGRHAELVTGLTEMVDRHPYRDQLRVYLMLILCRLGRQADALEVYRRTRAMLQDELGVPPGEPLQRVNEAVLRDGAATTVPEEILGPLVAAPITFDGAASADEPMTPPVPPAVVPRQTPPDLTCFTGRNKHVESLRRSLSGTDRSTAPRAVVVTGPAGVGKTALAVHVAHRLRSKFPDGQLYADLRGCAGPPSPAELLARFLIALGVDDRALPRETEDRTALFRSMLAGRRVLLILDDAVDEAQVRPLLPGVPGCAVLVTGRRALGGLGLGHVRLDALDQESALTLLARLAGRRRVAAEPEAALEIVQSCDRLPLALRIAGTLLALRPHQSLSRLADLLRPDRRRLDELMLGDLSVRDSLAMSYHGLRPKLRRTFRLLGVLDTPDIAAWICAAALDIGMREAEDLIDELVEAQLLETNGTCTGGGSRFRFSELVRLYARERAEMEESSEERLRVVMRALNASLAAMGTAGPGGGRNGRPCRPVARPGIRTGCAMCEHDADPPPGRADLQRWIVCVPKSGRLITPTSLRPHAIANG
jgi:DNA-binding SARP family transcriptional activator